MKYIFNFIMMFIGCLGYAQSAVSAKESNHVTTFPNGDESITIIENSRSNVLKLSLSGDFQRYQSLELSNHEAVHSSSNKKRINLMNKADQKNGNYTVIASDDRSDDMKKDSIIKANQGS
jgi:hypothetical protein